MNKLTEEETKKAFRLWVIKTERTHQDRWLKPFLSDEIQAWKMGQEGWLKRTRTGFLLSAMTLAKKLEVSHPTYQKYEESEKNGVITLATLAKVAEAMDCELVYALRPKSRKLISTLIWEKLLPMAVIHPWLSKCHPARRSESLLFIASRNLRDPTFRKQQGWSLRKNK